MRRMFSILTGVGILLLLSASLLDCGGQKDDGSLTLPRGSTISFTTDVPVSTRIYHEGDSFTGTLNVPFRRERVIFVPLGSKLDAVVDKTGEGESGRARISVRLMRLHLPNGQTLELDTKPITWEAKAPPSTGASVGASTGLDQTIKELAGENPASAGETGQSVEQQLGNEVSIPAGSSLVFTLASKLVVPPPQ